MLQWPDPGQGRIGRPASHRSRTVPVAAVRYSAACGRGPREEIGAKSAVLVDVPAMPDGHELYFSGMKHLDGTRPLLVADVTT